MRSKARLLILFSEIVEGLAHPSEIVKVGAVHSLEQLACSAPKLHWMVIETLQSHLRVRAPKPPTGSLSDSRSAAMETSRRLPEDVQAALTVIGRRNVKRDPAGGFVDLSGLSLRGAMLFEAKLAGARLSNADLREANLIFADLREAKLDGVDLSGAFMTQAQVIGAEFRDVSFERTNLSGVNFDAAHVTGARFDGAILWKAELGTAHGLTAEQLASAKTLNQSRLTASLEQSLSRDHPGLFDEPVWT